MQFGNNIFCQRPKHRLYVLCLYNIYLYYVRNVFYIVFILNRSFEHSPVRGEHCREEFLVLSFQLLLHSW